MCGTGMLPPQPLGDLLWRPMVIKFGGDQARQLRIGGHLAHFRTARPTGKVTAQSVERYEFFRNGRTVTLTLAGPVGADNVDPWRRITDSFAWSP